MNDKLISSFEFLKADYGDGAVMYHRSVPRGIECLLVKLDNSSQLIFTFSDECLQDHNESAIKNALQTTMLPSAENNLDREIFLNMALEISVQEFSL